MKIKIKIKKYKYQQPEPKQKVKNNPAAKKSQPCGAPGWKNPCWDWSGGRSWGHWGQGTGHGEMGDQELGIPGQAGIPRAALDPRPGWDRGRCPCPWMSLTVLSNKPFQDSITHKSLDFPWIPVPQCPLTFQALVPSSGGAGFVINPLLCPHPDPAEPRASLTPAWKTHPGVGNVGMMGMGLEPWIPGMFRAWFWSPGMFRARVWIPGIFKA